MLWPRNGWGLLPETVNNQSLDGLEIGGGTVNT